MEGLTTSKPDNMNATMSSFAATTWSQFETTDNQELDQNEAPLDQ